MGLGGIVILLLLLVSLIVFIYVIVKTARGWGVLHTIMLCFLFIECWVFMVFTAGVHYKRVRATADAYKQQEAAERATAETVRLLYGSINASPDALDAVIPVKGRLQRLTIDRGRVWRQLSLVDSAGGQYRLGITAPVADPLSDEPAAAAPAAPTSDSLPVDLVVYAFAEEVDEEGRPLPTFYLGEFRISSSQAGEVTLSPTLPLQSFQSARINSGEATSWSLFEMLPIDSHRAFAAQGSEPSDEAIFGRMDEESLQTLLAGIPESLKQGVLDAYLRDGQRASDDDRPETVWEQINITQDYSIAVDSDQSADATMSSYFDSSGRSIDIRLKRLSEVEMSQNMKSNRIVVTESTARGLVDEGKAERVQRIFVRPLNDYEEAFNQHHALSYEMDEQIKYYQYQTQLVSESNALGQEMLTFRQIENQKLASDLGNYQKEVAVLTESVGQATQSLTDLKKELSRMYRAVQGYHQQLVSMVQP